MNKRWRVIHFDTALFIMTTYTGARNPESFHVSRKDKHKEAFWTSHSGYISIKGSSERIYKSYKKKNSAYEL